MGECCGAPVFVGARDAPETLQEIGWSRSFLPYEFQCLGDAAVVVRIMCSFAVQGRLMLERKMEVSMNLGSRGSMPQIRARDLRLGKGLDFYPYIIGDS